MVKSAKVSGASNVGRSSSPAKIASSLNEYGAMGVSHLQLRFAARSLEELCDQMARFGAEVGPDLTR